MCKTGKKKFKINIFGSTEDMNFFFFFYGLIVVGAKVEKNE